MSDFITLKDANLLRPFTADAATLVQREYLPGLLELGQLDNASIFYSLDASNLSDGCQT